MKNSLIVKFVGLTPQGTRRMNRFRARIRSNAMRYARTHERYEQMFGEYLLLTEHGYPQKPIEEVPE